MKLVLVRHGMTRWNLEKRVQGRIDQPLCEQGRAQLLELRLPPALKNYRWYCSPLQRATESARLLGLEPIEIDSRLIEMSWGEWEGEILKPLRKKLGDPMRRNEARGIDFQPPGGESPRQVQRRLRHWLEDIRQHQDDCAAVVHKGIVRCLYSMACGWDMVGESPVDFRWNALHQFELDGQGALSADYRSISLLD